MEDDAGLSLNLVSVADDTDGMKRSANRRSTKGRNVRRGARPTKRGPGNATLGLMQVRRRRVHDVGSTCRRGGAAGATLRCYTSGFACALRARADEVSVQDAKTREKERSRVEELEAERTQRIPENFVQHAPVDHVSHLLASTTSTAAAAAPAASSAAPSKRKNMPSVAKPAKKRPAAVAADAAQRSSSSSEPRASSEWTTVHTAPHPTQPTRPRCSQRCVLPPGARRLGAPCRVRTARPSPCTTRCCVLPPTAAMKHPLFGHRLLPHPPPLAKG
jgi:hypothetical protein